MLQKRQFLIIGLGVLLLGFTIGDVLADQPAPGSSQDPLVTKSYVDNYIAQALKPLEEELEALEKQVARLEKLVDQGRVEKEVITLQMGSTTAYVGQKAVELDAPPYLEGSTTMLPFAFIGQALGAQVHWDGSSKKVTFEAEDTRVVLQIGSRTAQVNGKNVTLEVPPVIKDNRTFVPLRFVSQSLGAKVDWIAETKTIKITP